MLLRINNYFNFALGYDIRKAKGNQEE